MFFLQKEEQVHKMQEFKETFKAKELMKRKELRVEGFTFPKL